jgi:hypothetical protein
MPRTIQFLGPATPCAVDGRRRATTAGVIAGAGIVAALVGVLLLRDPRKHEEPVAPT